MILTHSNDGNQGDEISRNVGDTPGAPSSDENYDVTQDSLSDTTTGKRPVIDQITPCQKLMG
jgi:hypothetical protein